MAYNSELFSGTAEYYLNYRGRYCDEFIKLIIDEFEIDGKGRLLDIGCGTGKLSFPLSCYFSEVLAIDICEDMLIEGKKESKRLNINNIIWRNMPAKEISNEIGEFQLVTSGDAFHWMDREKVIELCYDRLPLDGGMAIVGERFILGNLEEEWQRATKEVIDKWVGKYRKHSNLEPHEEILNRSRFSHIKKGEFKYRRKQSIDSIIGYLFSTSSCNKRELGDKALAFERDIRQALTQINEEGLFEEPVSAYYIFAHKEK